MDPDAIPKNTWAILQQLEEVLQKINDNADNNPAISLWSRWGLVLIHDFTSSNKLKSSIPIPNDKLLGEKQ